MTTKAKTIAQRRKNDIMQDQMRVYSDLLALVEQALHARIIADALWKYRWDRVARTGVGNSVVSFSQVALENFAVLQLWKLFDSQSVFNVWYVAEYLPHPALSKWLENNFARVKSDVKLIEEWRGSAVAHRGAVVHYASDEYEKKFTEGRISEKRLHDFLLEFLCQIKFEMQRVPIEQTMEEFRLGLEGFEHHVNKCMKEIFKEI